MPIPLRNPHSLSCQQGADFLEARPGCRDDAHRAVRHDVGKAQRHAIQDGCTGSRSHQEQPVVDRITFERNFVFQ